MSRKMPDWERYERLVARLIADQISTDQCVTPNAQIKGVISSRKRQIDVLIDQRHDTDNTNRIIIDTKIKKRQIDIKDVEAFLGLMEDVQATHGYLVCPNGFTKSAERRAQEAISLRLLPLDKLDDFDPSIWPDCIVKASCKGKIFWDGYSAVDMVVRPIKYLRQMDEIISFIHYVGKCDKCRNFHVKCTTCNFTFSPPYDDQNDFGMQCKCQKPWFWLASIETDEKGNESAELHFINGIGSTVTVTTATRRSL